MALSKQCFRAFQSNCLANWGGSGQTQILLRVSNRSRRLLHSSLLPQLPLTYVNGKWIQASSGETFDVTNPATGEILARVPNCGVAEASAAVESARAAQTAWGLETTAKQRATVLQDVFRLLNENSDELAKILTLEQFARVPNCGVAEASAAVESARAAQTAWGLETTAKQRAIVLQDVFRLLNENSDELARILTLKQGKPLAEAAGEIAYGSSFFDWFAGESRRLYGEIVPPPVAGRLHMHFREPMGVAVMITPWNFPNCMITRKVAAALAAGCTTVVKPAEDTPLSALALATLAERAGVPPGVLNVVTADRARSAVVGEHFCRSPHVDVLSFTGSTAVGKMLLTQSADTVKRVCLELGGNAPFIVFDSADVDKAVAGLMASKFRASGQTCVCADRILVQADIYERFVDSLRRAVDTLKVGNGLEAGVTQGPLVNKRAVDKVSQLVNDACGKGARVLTGGKRLNDAFFAPTLLADVTADMDVSRTEIFGPVAAVRRFNTEEEALTIANDSRVGLAGYFFSQDVAQIFRVSRRLQAGMIGVNEGVFSCAEAVFGGVKESGLGREGGSRGIDEYTDWKYVCLGGLN